MTAGMTALYTFLKRHRLWQVTVTLMVVFVLYWGIFAARRYVSEAHVVVDVVQGFSGTPTAPDLSSLLSGPTPSRDNLLLRDYLLSSDMLAKLDAKLNLREHYSSSYDIFSRLLYKNIPFEWFQRHYKNRVSVEYDDTAGVLVILAQAYTPKMASEIAGMLVREGELFINELAQKLAREQVAFAEREVEALNKRLLAARLVVLAYQNSHGLASPTATVESISGVAAQLEGELAGLKAKRLALESYLAPTAPDLVQINAQVRAVEQQLATQRGRLASPGGKTLNRVAEEYERLLLDAGFQQDLYKTALEALQRARIDAGRTLKKVSVLQQPTMPEYSLEPARLYNIAVYLIATLLLTGILQLLLVIIREHRD